MSSCQPGCRQTCHSTGSKLAKWNLYSSTWVHFQWSHCESLPRGKGTEKAYRDGTEMGSIMNFVVTLSNTCKNYLTSSLDHTCMLLPSKQYELVCLKSCNAEHEEQLFGQVKWITENTTNRKLDNILPNVLLRLQAKSVTIVTQHTKTKPMPLAKTQEQSLPQKIPSLRLHLSVNDLIAGKHIWRK